MFNVELQTLTLDSYAQGPPGAGSWMELVDRRLPDPLTPPGPLSGTLPPFTEFDDPWGHADLFDIDVSDDEEEWEDDCDCGGPPPPIFNLPPPPPPPPVEEAPTEGAMEAVYTREQEVENYGREAKTFSHGVNREISPTPFWDGDCKDTSPSPQDACPALLIAGDAHVRPRLHPPIAALLVAAVTFAFVIGIAAVVCWRFRKQKNRQGSAKSTSDLTNGVIYDDLPSGPTPRGLTTHGHDTCTLAPMELLDLKLASQLHTASYSQERGPCQILLPPNALMPSTTTVVVDPNTQIVNNYSHYPNPYNMEGTGNCQFKDYTYCAKGPCVDFMYNRQNPCNSDLASYGPATFKDYKDYIRSDYAEPTSRRSPGKDSQEVYNPTYEEISTGSDSTSVSSENTDKNSHPSSPQRLVSPSKDTPGSWSPSPCPTFGVKKISSNRVGTRSHSQNFAPNSIVPCSAFLAEDYAEESPTHIYAAPPPIPPPALYTIPGTSDGRTSTSSSSDQPPERGREPRYYVGSNPSSSSIKSPVTPPEGYCSQYVGTPITQEKLPPLPSRSDRYRIFFTTDRKRALAHRAQVDSKTLDLASRKRNRTRDFSLSTDNEPLYHEL